MQTYVKFKLSSDVRVRTGVRQLAVLVKVRAVVPKLNIDEWMHDIEALLEKHGKVYKLHVR